jgi:hypothetical protein
MSRFWKIEETVGRGQYIVLDGIYETKAAADAKIARLSGNSGMRSREYETGTNWQDGPLRVDINEEIK